MEGRYYVYEHVRLDTNLPFYVGKGSRKDRALEKSNRNPWWKNIVKKYGYRIVIKRRFNFEKTALRFERYLQLKYQSKNYELCNLAECGAQGSKGVPHTKEIKQLIGYHSKKRWAQNTDYAQKMRARMGGLNNPISDQNIYDFYHSDHGIISCTQFELRSKFKIPYSKVSCIVTGTRKSVYGWTLLSNKDYIPHVNPTVFCWSHPFHEDYKCRKDQIMKMFPHLKQPSISRLINGEYKTTKGWKIDMENFA